MFSADLSTLDCPAVPDTNACPAEGASSGPVTDMDMTMQMQMTMKFSTAWSGVNIVFPNWVLNTKTGTHSLIDCYACSLLFCLSICVHLFPLQ
jgi:hypothetical protein